MDWEQQGVRWVENGIQYTGFKAFLELEAEFLKITLRLETT